MWGKNVLVNQSHLGGCGIIEGRKGLQGLVQQSLVVWLMVVIEIGSMLVVVVEFGLIE